MTREEYDELKNVISSKKNFDYSDAIFDTKSKTCMYFLSSHRKNVISWFPIEQESKILEIGGECGTISSYLSDRASHVDILVEDDYEKKIILKRLSETDNIDVQDNIESTLEVKYDYITMIGSLPRAKKYIDNEEPAQELLKFSYQHLTNGGELFIAVPNKLGLKYFDGYNEDCTGKAYAGILGEASCDGYELWSKKVLTEKIKNAGFNLIDFYYPYPDYVFTEEIYSDYNLPRVGDLQINNRDFSGGGIKIFRESDAWNEIIKEKMFPEFSNSYIVVAQK